MKTIGCIGYGRMNQMLIEGFIRTGIVTPGQIAISTKTTEKALPLLAKHPDVRLMNDNQKLARLADIIIVGVRPLQVLQVLKEIASIEGCEKHIVSIAGCVRTNLLTSAHPGYITRILPSICSTVDSGISLCYHHPRVRPDDAAYIEKLFGSISTLKMVEEDLFEPAGDLMSCGPALISKILLELACAGQRHSTLNRRDCLEMVIQTAEGTIRLLQDGMEPDCLIGLVATPGGITEEGVKILERDLPPVFDLLFDATLAKHALVREHTEEIYKDIQSDRITKAKLK